MPKYRAGSKHRLPVTLGLEELLFKRAHTKPRGYRDFICCSKIHSSAGIILIH